MATPPPWEREIVELHDFFAQWFGGRLPATDAAFARFADTMTPEFTIIAPTGTLLGRAELLPRLRAAHGSSPGCQIWIERPALRATHGDVIVATYEEWQRHAGRAATARLSTVVFRAQPATPNGLVWLHVHETWLTPQEAPDA